MSAKKRPSAAAKSMPWALVGPPSPMQMAKLAWAAGFLDGEACVHIAKHRHPGRRTATYRLAVSIAQNFLPVLEYFRGSVGIDAPIYKTKRANNHSRQCYTLNFSGRQALDLLQALAPYLQRKLEEAQNGFDFWVHGRMGVPGNGKRLDPAVLAIREHYYQRMKKLK